MEYSPQFQDFITKIRRKESWRKISDHFSEIKVKTSTEYQFQSGDNNPNLKYTEKEIWNICELLVQGLSGKEIAKKMNIEHSIQF